MCVWRVGEGGRVERTDRTSLLVCQNIHVGDCSRTEVAGWLGCVKQPVTVLGSIDKSSVFCSHCLHRAASPGEVFLAQWEISGFPNHEILICHWLTKWYVCLKEVAEEAESGILQFAHGLSVCPGQLSSPLRCWASQNSSAMSKKIYELWSCGWPYYHL